MTGPLSFGFIVYYYLLDSCVADCVLPGRVSLGRGIHNPEDTNF